MDDDVEKPKRAVDWGSVAVSITVGVVASALLLWGGDALGKKVLPLKSDALYPLMTDARTLTTLGRPTWPATQMPAWMVTFGSTAPLTSQGDATPADFTAGLQRYRRLKQKYGAFLVEVEVRDATSGSVTPAFVMLAPQAFKSKKSAAAWCKKRKLKSNVCTAIESASLQLTAVGST